jgi:O-antigen/teichoic acid export membrane protein
MIKALLKSLADDKILQRVLSNSSFLILANIVASISTFLQGIVVARFLGVEQYGLFVIITTYTSTVGQLVDSRVWEAVIKFFSQYKEQGDITRATAVVKLCYLIDIVTGSLAFVLLLLSSHTAARLFIKDPSVASLIQLYAFSLLVATPLGTSSALIRLGDRFDWLAYHRAGTAAIKLLLVFLGLAVYGYGIRGVLATYLLSTLVSVIIILILSRSITNQLALVSWKEAPFNLLKDDYTSIFRFLLVTNCNALLKLFQMNADILIVSYLLGATSAGYIRFARSMTNLMMFFQGVLYEVGYLEYARLWYQKEFQKLRKIVVHLILQSAFIAILGLIVLTLGGDFLIRLTVGQSYLPALPVMKWMALGTAIALTVNFANPLLLAIGKPSRSLQAGVAGTLFQGICLIILLPFAGITASGVSYVIFCLVWAIVAISGVSSLLKSEPKPNKNDIKK